MGSISGNFSGKSMKTFKEISVPRNYADGSLISAKLPLAYEKAKSNKNCANCGAYVPGTYAPQLAQFFSPVAFSYAGGNFADINEPSA